MRKVYDRIMKFKFDLMKADACKQVEKLAVQNFDLLDSFPTLWESVWLALKRITIKKVESKRSWNIFELN